MNICMFPSFHMLPCLSGWGRKPDSHLLQLPGRLLGRHAQVVTLQMTWVLTSWILVDEGDPCLGPAHQVRVRPGTCQITSTGQMQLVCAHILALCMQVTQEVKGLTSQLKTPDCDSAATQFF